MVGQVRPQPVGIHALLVHRRGQADAAVRGLASQLLHLRGKILSPAPGLVAQLVQEVAPVVSDGIIIVIPVAGKIPHMLHGQKHARGCFAQELVRGHQPRGHGEGGQPLAPVEHRELLGLLVQQKAVFVIGPHGFQHICGHIALH